MVAGPTSGIWRVCGHHRFTGTAFLKRRYTNLWNYDIRPAADVDEHDGVDPDPGPTRPRQRT
jgi:hypothetical protein